MTDKDNVKYRYELASFPLDEKREESTVAFLLEIN